MYVLSGALCVDTFIYITPSLQLKATSLMFRSHEAGKITLELHLCCIRIGIAVHVVALQYLLPTQLKCDSYTYKHTMDVTQQHCMISGLCKLLKNASV